MFYVVRLKEHNPAAGCNLRDYSGPSCRKYRAGVNVKTRPFKPSALVRVTDEKEIAHLRTVRQPNRPDVAAFDIFSCENEAQLAEFVHSEMEKRSRQGHPPIRAEVTQLPPEPIKQQPELAGQPLNTPHPENPNAPIHVEDIMAGRDPFSEQAPETPVQSLGDPDEGQSKGGDEDGQQKAPPLPVATKPRSRPPKDGRLCVFPRCTKNKYPKGKGYCGFHWKKFEAGKIDDPAKYRGDGK